METYRKDCFDKIIGNIEFVQDNESESKRDVLRGLHLQYGSKSQAKLVRVTEGAVFDVAVDMRVESPTFGKWFGTILSHENKLTLFVPRGFAHGFLVLSETARFVYKVDNYYAPEAEMTIAWDDEDIAIEWPQPSTQYILSERDRVNAIRIKEFIKTIRSDC